LGSPINKFNPEKFAFFAELSGGSDDTIKFQEFVNQAFRKSIFFKKIGIPIPQNPDSSLLWSLRTP
jgi:hypothetical protein